MIRISDIQNSLLHVVGWQQSYDTTIFKIADSITESESGLYFQQAHPLLTLENLQCISPDFKNIRYQIYSQEAQYHTGNVVSADDTYTSFYKAIKDSQGIQLLDTDYWMPTNPFSEWLEEKTKASIYKTVTRYINDKMNKGTYRNLFENKTLFDGTGRIVDTIKNRNNLVGFEIVPIRAKGVTTKINKIGLQFTQPGEYDIYIMHSSCQSPVYVQHITKLYANTMEWFKLDNVYLPYESDTIDAGGSWYICYFQSELPENSMAINKGIDWSKGPCKECSRRDFELWHNWSRYMEIHPFYVNEELVDREDESETESQPLYMWDIKYNMYDYSNTYGINLDITVGCDITDFIIREKQLFADVIMKQTAIDLLREMAYNANVRTNRHSINASKTDILYEIDGDSSSAKKSGLSYQLDLAYKSIEISTEGMNRICLPCVNHGIKYRTI